MSDNQPTVLLVPVHYKSSKALLDMLNSLEWLKGSPEVHILVADNASGEDELSQVRPAIEAFPNATLLALSSNRGYFGAARCALDHYRAQGEAEPNWVIVCNHDLLLEDRTFIAKLLQEDFKETAVIAPRIQVGPGKVDQNPFMRHRPGRLRWAQIRFISSSYLVAAVWDWLWRRKAELRSWLTKRHGPSQTSGVARQVIYAPHGSFVIFSRTFFEAGGYLDENLFLYGEEISVAEICRSLGLSVIYEPQLCVFHNEHQSTGRMLSRFTFECQKKAVEYLSARYMFSSVERYWCVKAR